MNDLHARFGVVASHSEARDQRDTSGIRVTPDVVAATVLLRVAVRFAGVARVELKRLQLHRVLITNGYTLKGVCGGGAESRHRASSSLACASFDSDIVEVTLVDEATNNFPSGERSAS